MNDVKILLISHAHWDHCAGSALLKQQTGAKYFVMDQDVAVVESGGKEDFQYGGSPGNQYKPAKVDRVLHDRDQVRARRHGDGGTPDARTHQGHHNLAH